MYVHQHQMQLTNCLNLYCKFLCEAQLLSWKAENNPPGIAVMWMLPSKGVYQSCMLRHQIPDRMARNGAGDSEGQQQRQHAC